MTEDEFNVDGLTSFKLAAQGVDLDDGTLYVFRVTHEGKYNYYPAFRDLDHEELYGRKFPGDERYQRFISVMATTVEKIKQSKWEFGKFEDGKFVVLTTSLGEGC